MDNEYLIVRKNVLPDYYDKVIEAKQYLQSGQAKDVTDAVRRVGISRSTYYKYKDEVFLPNENDGGRKAVISFRLHHEPGTLSRVLTMLSDNNANVFTISQNPPVSSRALVVISVIVDNLRCSITELLEQLEELPGVEKCMLLDID